MSVEPLIKKIVKDYLVNLTVAIPAKVTSVERLSDGFINAIPLVNSQNNISKITYENPEIRDIRVVFPSTKNSTICFPVAVGDFVELTFQSVSIEKFINGNTEQHDPNFTGFGNRSDCIARVGFEPFQQSCMNPNNYQNDFDNQNLNIVHNKNTENEVTFTLRTDGTVGVIAPEGVDYTTKKFKVDCEEFEVNASKSSRTISPLISQNGI